MFIYKDIYIYIYIYTHSYVCNSPCMYLNTHIHAYIHTCVHTYDCVHIYIYIYTHMPVSVCMCACVRMFVCTCSCTTPRRNRHAGLRKKQQSKSTGMRAVLSCFVLSSPVMPCLVLPVCLQCTLVFWVMPLFVCALVYLFVCM